MKQSSETRNYNVGKSDYAKHKIQPWDIWKEYNLNPWDADIVKRVLRTKENEPRSLDYEKIIHVCMERIRQLAEEAEAKAAPEPKCKPKTDSSSEDDDEEDIDGTTVFCPSESHKPGYSTNGGVFSVYAVFQSLGHWYAYLGYSKGLNEHLYLALTGEWFYLMRLEDFPLPVVSLRVRLDDIEHSASVKIGAPGIRYEKYDYIISNGTLYRYMGHTEDKKLYKYGQFKGNGKIDSVVLPIKLQNLAMQVTCGK